MTSQQWIRVRELFEAALDREADEVAAWIEAREPDHAVRAEVLSLLDHHSRAGQFLSEPIGDRVPELVDEPSLAPGAAIGPYTVVREIGRGGMGRVYLASDSRLGRHVALKALAQRFTRDPSHRERLRREARAAAALSHPNICTVYALEELGDELFIVTEFVDGHTLRDEIASGRRPTAEEIVETARQLAAALASAHAAGITHRDLKPENVMRTSDGRIKVLDFGLARFDRALSAPAIQSLVTIQGALVGTPAYMAPEQLNREPVDARTDVFAYGVLMYEFCCGAHPFAAASNLALFGRIIESDAQPLMERCPQAPITIAGLIERCLRKAPGERFASGGEMLDAIVRGIVLVRPRSAMLWWRTHQLAVMALYVAATTLAWYLKEAFGGALLLWLFVGVGAAAAIGGIIRGHLVFTERMNRPRLVAERRRTSRASLAVDLFVGASLFVDALAVAPVRPLYAVLTIALALGIALAAVLMEPATTEAALRQ